MDGYEDKCKKLWEVLEQYAKENLMVAFSGGVDSSLLLWLLCKKCGTYGTTVHAVTLHTTLHPAAELEIIRAAAKEAGATHKIIYVDELKKAGIEDNPKDRCYRCKKYMFTRVQEEAERLGIHTVIEGTNLDDTREYRPGIQALKELGIKSPLVEAGFTKADVRRLAKELGISTAEKPSTPCLATRFPYDTHLTYEEMQKVDAMEQSIRAMGFYNVRTRVHGNLVRIEVDKKDIPMLLERSEEVVKQVKEEGYVYVTIDMEGFRSGSQDVLLHDLQQKG